MNDLAKPFPDLELALIQGIPPLLAEMGKPDVKAGDTAPSNLATVAAKGFVRVQVLSDPDDAFTRRATVDIDYFALTRAGAYDLGVKTHGILLSARSLGGVVLDRVETVSGPKRVPWGSQPEIRRFLSTYRISTRR